MPSSSSSSSSSDDDDRNESIALADRLGALVSSSDDESDDSNSEGNAGAGPVLKKAGSSVEEDARASMRARLAAAIAGGADVEDDGDDNDDVYEDLSDGVGGGDRVDFNLGSPRTVDTGAGSMMRMSPLTIDDKISESGLDVTSSVQGDDDVDKDGHDGAGKKAYTKGYIQGLAQSALRRLAREHKVSLSGGRASIEARLLALRDEESGNAHDSSLINSAAPPARPVRLSRPRTTGRRTQEELSPTPKHGDDDDGRSVGESTADLRMLTDTDADRTDADDTVDLRILVSGSSDDETTTNAISRADDFRSQTTHNEDDDSDDSTSRDDDDDVEARTTIVPKLVCLLAH